MMPMATVLVVDDEPRSLEALRRTLEDEFDVRCADSGEAALELLARERVQVMICDQRMPGLTGVETFKRARQDWPDVVRIILSGYTETEDLITGINDAGIYQYLLKPWQPESLLLAVRAAAQMHRLQAEHQRLNLELRAAAPVAQRRLQARHEQLQQVFDTDRLVRAAGSPMHALCGLIERIAPYDIATLICGESGTGKELLARALHYRSGRATGAFVVENCGALPDQLLEAELFGHKRGAFTGAHEDRIGLFQQADGGTIFLDEIGETTPAFQVKLLRVLQEGEIRPLGSPRTVSVDVRVVSATNRDLEAEVRAGRFRQDLYYRLSTMTLTVPPLRERAADIPLIAEAVLRQAVNALRKSARGFTQEAMDCLVAYRWPGNVRELQNEIYRLLALSEGDWLGAEHLSRRVVQAAAADDEPELELLAGVQGSLKERLDLLESRVLKEAMVRHRWNKTRVAEELGLSRVGLRAKLSRYGLDPRHAAADAHGSLS